MSGSDSNGSSADNVNRRVQKADYSILSQTFDQARHCSDSNVQFLLKRIETIVGTRSQVKFLDLGCGTGRFALPICEGLGYTVTGADSSAEMLAMARTKLNSHKVDWDLQEATGLTYADSSFDVIFMSHLLHHLDAPMLAIKECFRVLRCGGILINRYGALEDILDDPEHRFFRGSVQIDERRTLKKFEVEDLFRESGFVDITSETLAEQTNQTAKERFDKASLKSTSVLALIASGDFEEGLKKMHDYITCHPDDPWLITNRITFTRGTKDRTAGGAH